MGDFDVLAETIIQNIGGKENILDVTHCATRLRFSLKEESLANTEVLKNIKEILAIRKACGQYQIVIGIKVPYLYRAVCRMIEEMR